jgi:hypothetical protein
MRFFSSLLGLKVMGAGMQQRFHIHRNMGFAEGSVIVFLT